MHVQATLAGIERRGMASRMKFKGRLLFSLIWACAGTAGALDADSFLNPQKDQFPETWFHLIGGNVSRQGLSADLDAIAQAGISGIQLFHGQFGGPWPGVTNQIPCLSRDWDDLIRFAADGCARRGLVFKMQNCPGWSMSGGPWIAPSNAMRNLTYSSVVVKGGSPVRMMLPMPDKPTPEIRISEKDRDYHDLFVLAFPAPNGFYEKIPEPKLENEEVKSGRHIRRLYRFPCPVVVRSVSIPPPCLLNKDWAYDMRGFASLSAVYRDGAKLIADSSIPNGCWQDNVPFTMSGCGESGRVEPTDAWELTIECEHAVDLPYVRFSSALRNHNWEGKAGWVLRGVRTKGGLDVRPGLESMYVNGESVLDITGAFKDGVLEWTPPAGDWTVMRIGHVNNGARNAPAPKEATGWECNKMDTRGIDAHFAAYIGRLADGPLSGGKLKGFVVDSWECCRQTWTERLERDFRELRGYDLRKKLPAVFGWIMDSPGKTDAFLRDWRQTLGELVERNYYARIAELARERGMSAQYETAFGDVLPGDLMAFWKHCDTPMCEFWFPRAEQGVGQDDFKPIVPCASAAHIYGKRRVAAEAFTTTSLKWDEDPKRLKACANHAFARGVTHLVFHTYTHNPRTDWKLPGSSFGTHIGTPFIRGQSWWGYMSGFTEWAARCGAMLEAGKPANDILWFLGEDVDHKPGERSPFPHGYKYDYVNRDALLSRISVKDGMFTTPEGVAWKVLWVPHAYMSEVVGAKLRELADAGGRVVAGRVHSIERDMAKVLEGIPPDVTCGPDVNGRAITDWRKSEQPIDWIHRRDESADWYFVAANGMDAYSGDVVFRMVGDVEVWNPMTGERFMPEALRTDGNSTRMRLDLAPAECMFVVFSHKGGQTSAALARHSRESYCRDLRNLREWALSFPGGWGAPGSLKIKGLKSWTELPLGEEGRSFSGTASYRTSFEGREGEDVELDLGEVETAAEVFVNGKNVRKLWAPPYRCDIGMFVKDGQNELRIDVTSTWFNRLVYDEGLPVSERKTWTHAALPKGTPYKPAGLLGPVMLRHFGDAH